MKVRTEAVLREIAGEYILLPVGAAAAERTGFYVLSDVAKRIWDLLPEVNAAEEIVTILLEEYDIDRETLTTDTNRFFDDLRAMCLLEP